MAEEGKPNVIGGFEALAGELISGVGIPDPDNNIPEIDPEEIKRDEEEEESIEKEIEDREDELTEDEKVELEKLKAEEEEAEEPEEKEDPEEIAADELDFGEWESPLTKMVQEELYKELGWDLDEDEQFDSVKDLVDYLKTNVETASKPNYSSQEIENLDSFIKSGGKLEDYLVGVPAGSIDLENVDLTDGAMQKEVVKEHLSKVMGYKEDRIKRTITRYEEGGILEDEAEEAAELLKEYKATSQKKLLDDQDNYAKEAVKSQQKFYSDVEERVKALKEIRGIPISSGDKDALLDYMFKPGSNGKTKYQTDYMSSVGNFIESAFFTRDKDKNTLVNNAKKSAKSDAYKEIHRKIKASKGKRQKSSGSQDIDISSGTLGNLGQSLIKKN